MFYLINRFTVTGDEDEFHRLMKQVNAHMTSQPGFHAHRLYRSLREPNVYVETSEWESQEQHRAAMDQDAFWGPVKQIGKHATPDPSAFTIVRENRALGAGTLVDVS